MVNPHPHHYHSPANQIENFIMTLLTQKFPKDQQKDRGRDLFDAFRPRCVAPTPQHYVRRMRIETLTNTALPGLGLGLGTSPSPRSHSQLHSRVQRCEAYYGRPRREGNACICYLLHT